jgi:uncharacterized membrane protein YbhN (UPF0104 family)
MPLSIAQFSIAMSRRNIIRAAQVIFAVLVLWFIVRALAKQWHEIGGRLANLHIEWGALVLASLLVFIAYAVLIETWRRVLGAWNARLSWSTAAEVWFASSLAKYIPGNIWALAALGVMARERGASGVAAAGSSIIVNVLNLVSGIALVLLFAAPLVPYAAVLGAVALAVVAFAVAAPFVLPPVIRWACRFTGRTIAVPEIPHSTTWLSLAGTAFAWCAYGVAFKLFAIAIVGGSAVQGTTVLYVAAYTAAYILGFVTPTPAGLGVREAGLIEALSRLGLTSAGDAVIIAITSRLWLTVLEVIPGLIALAVGHTRTRTRPA